MGIAVEIKNVFQNSIVYGKKNRFVGWTGKDQENPLIKGLDGLADSNPIWIRKWFHKIITKLSNNQIADLKLFLKCYLEQYLN